MAGGYVEEREDQDGRADSEGAVEAERQRLANVQVEGQLGSQRQGQGQPREARERQGRSQRGKKKAKKGRRKREQVSSFPLLVIRLARFPLAHREPAGRIRCSPDKRLSPVFPEDRSRPSSSESVIGTTANASQGQLVGKGQAWSCKSAEKATSANKLEESREGRH